MANSIRLENVEQNFNPIGTRLLKVIDGAKDFEDLGFNFSIEKSVVQGVTIDTDGDLHYRCDDYSDAEDIATTSDEVVPAGKYLIGRSEGVLARFLPVGANVNIIIQPVNFNQR